MRIPQFNRQVEEAQVPTVRVQGGVSPGEAAQAVGNRLDGIKGLVTAGANVYSEYQDQTNRVRVMDAENQLNELEIHLKTNKTDGYYNKKGVDVVGFNDGEGGNFVDYYQRAFQDGVAQIAARLGNDAQRRMFNQSAQRSATGFSGNLQSYFVRENDTYQQSVYAASADRYVRNISEDPLNFGSVDENKENLKVALSQKVKLEGGSATEADNAYIKIIATTHSNNINAFIENGALTEAVLYKKKYQSELAPLDDARLNQRILKKLEDRQVEVLANQVTLGTQPNSSPYGAPPQASKEMAFELKNLPPDQAKNLKYNDPRISAYVSLVASERNMEDMIPLIEGLRLAGEKSNNDQVSEAGAKSFMQFIPSTWHGDKNSKNGYKWDRKTGRERDINNPADVVEASFDFVSDIAKKYKTGDPMVIAAYYHGGDEDARLVLAGKPPKGPRGRAYLERLDKWINGGFDKYYSTPLRTREQAYATIQKMDVSLEVRERVQASMDKQFAAEDRVKKEKQDAIYKNNYTAIASGQLTYDQIPVSDISALAPNQIASLRAFSKSIYTDVKTDPVTLSMITLNQNELFKGKPQSVIHQYADKLSPADYKAVTQMYLEVNKPQSEKAPKEKSYIISDGNVALALKPYLNTIGITDTKNKEQLLHYNAVKADIMQTLREAEAKNGGSLTWQQINRLVLKNINTNVTSTYSRLIGSDYTETNRMYSEVKKKSDISVKMRDKITEMFKIQGRNPDKVTDSEYLNAYYSMLRRGF